MQVVEEDRRAKEPKNMEARKRKAEYILQEEQAKAECLAAGRSIVWATLGQCFLMTHVISRVGLIHFLWF